ncbi:MAG: uracil-DNA glycosylase [archaeon]|nr:uracil-DNA glycosylase [archaeon]
MTQTIFSLAEGIRKCTSCPLWKGRTLTVPGEGMNTSKIMLIGEAPGVEEDRQGLPFFGKSGTVLDEMINLAGISRKDTFITGAVKCHPPKNRNPSNKELKTCRELWLDKQIEVIKPKLIILLGKSALFSMIGKGKITEIHGKTISKKYFVTYHPSAAMRFPTIKQEMEQDFKILGKLLKKL